MFGKKKKKAEVPVGETPKVNLKEALKGMKQKSPKDYKNILEDVAKRKGLIDESTGDYWVRLDDAIGALNK